MDVIQYNKKCTLIFNVQQQKKSIKISVTIFKEMSCREI